MSKKQTLREELESEKRNREYWQGKAEAFETTIDKYKKSDIDDTNRLLRANGEIRNFQETLVEIIRWLVKPSSADNAKELEMLRKQNRNRFN